MTIRWGWPIGLAGACIVAACAGRVADEEAPADASTTAARPGEYCRNGVAVAVPDSSLTKLDFIANPTLRKFTIRDYAEPCTAETRLLVVRVSGMWCGTCQWHAAHTRELQALDVGPRIQLLDVLVSDEENTAWEPWARTAIVDMTDKWRATVSAPAEIVIERDDRVRKAVDAPAPLPLYVFVDRRTMRVTASLANPAPEEIENAIRKALAEGDGLPVPSPRPVARFDGRFDREEHDLIEAMRLPGAPPPDPTNEYADAPLAIALGKKLFSDPTLSPHGKSCASCHDATKSLTDGLALSVGTGLGDRNAPNIALAAHSRWQLWDGAADSLWMQALLPFENSLELNSSRVFVVHRLMDAYAAEYQAVFGKKYPAPDLSTVPRSDKPWHEIAVMYRGAREEIVTRPFVNAGKAIAAFVRTIGLEEEPIDRYARGDLGALTEPQKDGLKAFFTSGCAQCHFGPRLTDDAFHVMRWPNGGERSTRATGRPHALDRLRYHPFNRASQFSDAPGLPYLPMPGLIGGWFSGGFRTPTLRGVAHTAPYGHAGAFASLAEAVAAHGQTLESDGWVKTPVESWMPLLDEKTAASITDFMSTFTGRPIIP